MQWSGEELHNDFARPEEMLPDFARTAHGHCGSTLDHANGDLLEWHHPPTLEAMLRPYINMPIIQPSVPCRLCTVRERARKPRCSHKTSKIGQETPRSAQETFKNSPRSVQTQARASQNLPISSAEVPMRAQRPLRGTHRPPRNIQEASWRRLSLPLYR